ncbi:MAG: diguanylate phosphodiesterase [Thermoanaerobaculaceae bacterium]
MPQLIHLVYASAARREHSEEELARLLETAGRRNAELGITGMLLHLEGSFFQVLEGEAEAVDGLFARISSDPRHGNVTVIVRESIPRRAFADWTMAYAALGAEEAARIAGVGEGLASLDAGRARKLLHAFTQGRWRARLTSEPSQAAPAPVERVPHQATAEVTERGFSFAFQPIVHAPSGTVVAYEALVRGAGNEPAGYVLQQVRPHDRYCFDERSRGVAIELAACLGLDCALHINLLPRGLGARCTRPGPMLAAAARAGIAPERLVLEIVESEAIRDHASFLRAVDGFRAAGLRVALDDFGAGYAGLTLLAELQPDIIKLDMELVRGIDRRGPRQAIVRGIVRTCLDLGVDLVAEGIESPGELAWCRAEGIELFQGNLIAEPAFERLPAARLPG